MAQSFQRPRIKVVPDKPKEESTGIRTTVCTQSFSVGSSTTRQGVKQNSYLGNLSDGTEINESIDDRTEAASLGPVNPDGHLDHHKSNRKTIRINVGGQIFETFHSTILSKPKTRLYWLVDDNAMGFSHEDIEYRTGELFFDRDPVAFNSIMQYYRSGKLHSPLNLCGPAFQEELKFWQIDEEDMEPCCWPTYETHMQAANTITEMTKEEEKLEAENSQRRISNYPVIDKFRIMLSQTFLESTPLCATMYHTLSTTFTMTSVITISLISMPQLRQLNGSESPYIFKPEDFTVRELLMSTEPNHYLLTIDLICNLYFIVEFMLLLFAANTYAQFFKNGLNILDLVNNMVVIIEYIKYLVNPSCKLDWSNWFYFSRTTRIVRLMRHISGLEVIFYTFKASLPELTLLMSLFSICVVLLGTTFYLCQQFAEQPSNKITNIPISYYWAVISLTTVGYGDYSPTCPIGYVVGILTAIMGILVIVLPVPIIANNFCLFYAHAQARSRRGKSCAKRRFTLFG